MIALKDTKVLQVLIDGIWGAVKQLAGACGPKNECPKRIHYGLLRRNGLSPIVLLPMLLLPVLGLLAAQGAPYYYCYYTGTNAYLDTSSADNQLYYLGPASGNTLLAVGPLLYWGVRRLSSSRTRG